MVWYGIVLYCTVLYCIVSGLIPQQRGLCTGWERTPALCVTLGEGTRDHGKESIMRDPSLDSGRRCSPLTGQPLNLKG